jgi:ubiquinone/menaquinone biosynthesis C-methylase UbiE
MTNKKNHVCPASHAWVLDNPFRRLFQKPKQIVGEFIKPGDRVIDLGCGPGFFTLAMAELVGPGGRVLAVDLQPRMIEKLRSKLKQKGLTDRVRTHVCAVDGLNLPPDEAPGDFALLYYMIHESPDPKGMLRQLHAHLRPGGRALVVDPVFHVKQACFEAMIRDAQELGYEAVNLGRQKGGWAAVLTR